MPKGNKKKKGDIEVRIAIINPDKCKPKKCGLECKRFCPINLQEKVCVQVSKKSKCS